MPVCNKCLKNKDPEEFNYRHKLLGIRHHICKECQRPYKRKWYHDSAKERHLENVRERNRYVREEAKEFVYQYLLTHPCETCGESDVRVLEFHHVGGKDMAVSAMVGGGYSIPRIEAELAKCTVLCANCHRKITVEERGWFRGKK